MHRPVLKEMIDPIKTVLAASPAGADTSGSDNSAPAPAPAPAATVAKAPDEPLRLVVEPAPGPALGYTYKLFDRLTGALLIELPRETASKLSASTDYTAGQLLDAKA